MQLHVVVRGRVQGVGFRWFVRESARQLNLAGWVLNLPDGSVEVAADGSDESIHALRDALADGPPGANVRSVDDLPPVAQALDHPFTISR
jgi:acylphosphatase